MRLSLTALVKGIQQHLAVHQTGLKKTRVKNVFPSHLHVFVCLESQRRLNEQLSVLHLMLEGGNVDIAEWHVILRKTKRYESIIVYYKLHSYSSRKAAAIVPVDWRELWQTLSFLHNIWHTQYLKEDKKNSFTNSQFITKW